MIQKHPHLLNLRSIQDTAKMTLISYHKMVNWLFPSYQVSIAMKHMKVILYLPQAVQETSKFTKHQTVNVPHT